MNKDKQTSSAGRPPYTVREALEKIDNKLCSNSFYAAIQRGEIEHIRVGNKILILADPYDRKFGLA